MSLDNRTADRQAHAHAIRLRREEGIEQLTGVRRVDANTAIPDLNQYLSGVVRLGADQKFTGRSLTTAMA